MDKGVIIYNNFPYAKIEGKSFATGILYGDINKTYLPADHLSDALEIFKHHREKWFRLCHYCGNRDFHLKPCADCNMVYYCNDICRALGWQLHYQSCDKK